MDNFMNSISLPLVVLMLIVGFVLLIKGADFFVEGSSSVAKRFKVPSVIIGLTIVAMGTSLPETAVSVTASVNNQNALAISNAIGSNIFNLMVVIGVCALMTSIAVGPETIKRDIPFSGICALLLLGLGVWSFCDGSSMVLGHFDGIVLLILFACYIGMLIKTTVAAVKAGKEVDVEGGSDEDIKLLPIAQSVIYIVGGGAAIALGGDISVSSASRIAAELGMSQTLIGLTVVSIGTSLPELVTSIVAAKKNEVGMALGNAVGSNVFNFLMVLGIASAISPITVITENLIDIVVLLVFTAIVWLLAASRKKLGRRDGIIMLLMYSAYAVYIFVR